MEPAVALLLLEQIYWKIKNWTSRWRGASSETQLKSSNCRRRCYCHCLHRRRCSSVLLPVHLTNENSRKSEGFLFQSDLLEPSNEKLFVFYFTFFIYQNLMFWLQVLRLMHLMMRTQRVGRWILGHFSFQGTMVCIGWTRAASSLSSANSNSTG